MKLGNTFSDNLIIQSKISSKIRPLPHKRWWQGAGRALLLTVLFWVGIFILVVRLFSLTIIDGYRFRALADENRTRELVRHAPRGILYDRTGKPLVENIPRFRLLSPCESKPEDLCITKITQAEGEKMQAQGLPPKHFLEIEYLRKYLYPEATAHVVGYTGELNAQELEDEYYQLRKYQRGDQLGRTGAETVFEERLRGRNGRELIEVDATGRILRVLGRDTELSGEDITLSIDAELSQIVADSFPKNKRGAVIVSKPETGEVLAMYSQPTFSLNKFSLGMSQDEYSALITNADRPLFNRAIGGVYPPASTYKIVVSWAALEEGVIEKNTKIEDTGVITIGLFKFHNWYFTQYGKTDGMVDVVRALAHSNDIFYYKVGEMMGITKLREWSRKLGIGTRLGIQLPGEAEGLLPGPDWKNNQFVSKDDIQFKRNEWYVGDTYHMSIGQGYLLTTPLQVNAWTDAIANGGFFCNPTILKIHGKHDPRTCRHVPLQEETKKLLYQGMVEACEEGGTGWPLFNYQVKVEKEIQTASGSSSIQTTKRIPVACKTGTAEFGHPQNKTHAWFTVLAPVPTDYAGVQQSDTTVVTGESEIAITVLIEEGGEGSTDAAPVAKKILDYWFSR
jgi:penicillin-binding protein 2